MPQPTDKKYLTAKELEKALDGALKSRTLRKLASSGKIPSHRVGTTYLFTLEEVLTAGPAVSSENGGTEDAD